MVMIQCINIIYYIALRFNVNGENKTKLVEKKYILL